MTPLPNLVQAGRRVAAGLFFLVLAALPLLGQDPTARERALQQKLVAACCWSESLAVHRSQTSLDMRVELHKLIEQGKSDAEILQWFKTQYGARVLIEPEGASSILAYAFPFLGLLLGLYVVIRVLRRWARPPVESASQS